MKKIYGSSNDWNKNNWKKSFENLANDGYSFEKIRVQDWFLWKMEAWQSAVMCQTLAQKVIKKTEKAICFSLVNQYGNIYDMWMPKSAVISY